MRKYVVFVLTIFACSLLADLLPRPGTPVSYDVCNKIAGIPAGFVLARIFSISPKAGDTSVKKIDADECLPRYSYRLRQPFVDKIVLMSSDDFEKFSAAMIKDPNSVSNYNIPNIIPSIEESDFFSISEDIGQPDPKLTRLWNFYSKNETSMSFNRSP